TDISASAAVASGADTLVISTLSGPEYSEEEPGLGVASISADVQAVDNVTASGPNIASISMNAFFDYWRPMASFGLPLEGRKYCKNQLQLQVEAKDRGSDSELQITRCEYKTDVSSWTSVVCDPPLPADSASTTFWIDITSIPEGEFGLSVRSFDRAGNHSDNDDPTTTEPKPTDVSITIDRTPPVAPTLILPLDGTASRLRGYNFKWSKVTDGQMYLFQIADDSAFNNILNNTAQVLPATYGTIIGELTPMTQAAFSAPKDGVYYWRVAALELCQDGYNISKWSTTWRLVVDTVKPRVLEVQPTPSTGNKVSSGLVTFTIRFSENMDVTVMPTVTLTSAGGEQMKIEQQTYRDNTWTGTTIIPKNSSALYDGNAVISISGAKDLAGNEMQTDSTNQIIVNTGPAFETKIFSNPAHEWEIVVVTRSTEALQAPPTCAVTQSGNRVPVTMNFLKEKYYAGAYRINPDQPGKAYIDVYGTDLFGMVGQGSVEFIVANLNSNIKAKLSTSDNLATLDIDAGTVAKKTNLYILPRSVVEGSTTGSANGSKAMSGALKANRAYSSAGTRPTSGDLLELETLEEVGPRSVSLLKPMKFTASIKNEFGGHDLKKVGLYRHDGSRWIYCGPVSGGNKVSASITGTG
ncbi:MAG TPA: hypothetical protein PKO06_18525, partial [Candidatus Ozemobacteraceae bacterium]|nr:hypothetical protein [Candidatus Ozemobacteraceae bacterium]